MVPLWASSEEEDDVEDMDNIEGMSTSQLSTPLLAPAPPLSPLPIVHISLAGCVCMKFHQTLYCWFCLCCLLSANCCPVRQVCERLSDWR